jgi:hypothetical protein
MLEVVLGKSLVTSKTIALYKTRQVYSRIYCWAILRGRPKGKGDDN